MDAPLYMRLKFAEMPCEIAAESSDYEGWLSRSWIQEEFVHIDELPARLELPRRYSFRYVEVKIIDTSPKWRAVFSDPVLMAESSADYSRLKMPEINDDVMRRIYTAGVKTLSDCMQDVFENGPKRDRWLWLGDLRLQALADYATFDNVNLVKRCIYLKQFVALAKIAGDPEISRYEEVLSKMIRYSREKLYDPSRKLFVSCGEYNIASQVWMVLAHVMTDDENKEILLTMIRELFPVKGIATPYMYHHIAEALFEGGLNDEAEKLIRDYWGKMLELGADTFWEAFDPDRPDYSPYGSPIVNSYCHAWSCTPVYLLKKYIIG